MNFSFYKQTIHHPVEHLITSRKENVKQYH
jgi:hypothetical protein